MPEPAGQIKFVSQCICPYWLKRKEIAIKDDCVLWGTRIVVPKKLQQSVLEELHTGRTGVVLMKALARSLVWWPRLDEDIENGVKACQEIRNSPPKSPLHPWEWPAAPWQRLHIDFAGLEKGKCC